MLELFRNWFFRRFSDPHAVALVVILVLGFAAIYFFGSLLAPLLAAIVIAYLLDWPVNLLARYRTPRVVASSLMVLLFVSTVLLVALSVVPKFVQQAGTLIADLPEMFNQSERYLMELPEEYPDLIAPETVNTLVSTVKNQMLSTGQALLSQSMGSLANMAGVMIYLVLVPLLVFFLLKDKEELIDSFTEFLPRQRRLANQVWLEVNAQIANYVRGKIIEIAIVGVTTSVVFALFGLRYSVLLGVIVGLSVLIPYIGAAVVTIPVALVALYQWGLSPEFGYVMLAYGFIQLLDGNVLVPILFSEAVNLHPVSIIVAVLVFGGMWGFWGIFFAIPLATLVKAVANAFPTAPDADIKDVQKVHEARRK